MASASRPSSKSEVLGFADFRLDLRAGELHRNGSVVRMQRQPFQLLSYLVEHAGEVVSREELRQLLWQADTFVDFDNGLNASINKVREALGHSVGHPRFVETLPRRGYRFIAPVSVIPWNAAPPVLAERAAASPVVTSKPDTAGSSKKWLLAVALATAAVGAAVAGWRLLSRPAPPQEVRAEQITTNAAEIPITGAALSPDGKFLAYSDPTGTYLRVVATGETHTLPVPDALELRPDAWFPDSTNFLATQFPRSRASETPSLWKVPVVGSPRKLIDDGFAGAVSPDGSRIAFVRGALNVNTQGGREVLAMGMDVSAPRLLPKAEGSEWMGSLTWSPDSKRIAYLRSRRPGSVFDDMTSIEVQSLDSDHSSTLLRSPRLGNGLLWAGDGRIFYALAESTTWGSGFVNWASTSCSIWAVPVSSSTFQQQRPAVRIASASGQVSRFSLSKSTGTLAFVNEVKQTDVYLSELEASAKSATPPRRLTLSDSNDVPLTWTPDGRSVIFISDRNRYVNIYRQAVDQATPELIVGGRVKSWTPRLTPDGQHLVYLEFADATVEQRASGKSDHSVRIMEVSLSGGVPRHVLTAPDIGNVNCSKAGGCIYGTWPGGELFSFDLTTGATRRILQLKGDPAHCCGWSLSPDGQTLAVAGAVRNGKISLISIPTKMSRELVITNWPGLGSSQEPVLGGFDWAADGKGLFLSADIQPGGLTLLYVDLQGNARVLLNGGNIRWAIPSPDGRYLALHTFSSVRNVWFAALGFDTRSSASF